MRCVLTTAIAEELVGDVDPDRCAGRLAILGEEYRGALAQLFVERILFRNLSEPRLQLLLRAATVARVVVDVFFSRHALVATELRRRKVPSAILTLMGIPGAGKSEPTLKLVAAVQLPREAQERLQRAY